MKRRGFLKGLAAFAAVPGTISLSGLAPASELVHIASVPLHDVKLLPEVYAELGPMQLIRLNSKKHNRDFILRAGKRHKRIRITNLVHNEDPDSTWVDELAYQCQRGTDEMLMDHCHETYGDNWRQAYRAKMEQMG